jgi:hypothetical protein
MNIRFINRIFILFLLSSERVHTLIKSSSVVLAISAFQVVSIITLLSSFLFIVQLVKLLVRHLALIDVGPHVFRDGFEEPLPFRL